ncbi:hypothetical protein SDA20_10190 [Legionella pneumophila serogroup 1]|nr:hypothetical protein [Legionella pneumophila]HDO9975789.1 hypothetical protein [Legionella pneumophila]
MRHNEVINTQTQGTYSKLAALSILVAVGNGLLIDRGQEEPRVYYSKMDASSYDSFTNIVNENPSAHMTAEDIITNLYTKLVNAQEDIGPEFNSVYFKNAWNLYES